MKERAVSLGNTRERDLTRSLRLEWNFRVIERKEVELVPLSSSSENLTAAMSVIANQLGLLYSVGELQRGIACLERRQQYVAIRY